MTIPRIFSLTALAASLIFIVMTITQANGLTTAAPQIQASSLCLDVVTGETAQCSLGSTAAGF